MNAYEVSLATFIEHRAAVTKASAAAVSARIEAVIKGAGALKRDLERLELADAVLIGRCATRRFLRDEPFIGTERLLGALDLFLPVVQEAREIVAKEPKSGRMPAIAERALAEELGQILFEESQTMPTQTIDGQFDRLVRLAFVHAKAKARKNVTDLLVYALPRISKDMSLLASFRATRPDAYGKNRPREPIFSPFVAIHCSRIPGTSGTLQWSRY